LRSGETRAEISDHRLGRLLRPRRQRPHGRRTPDKSDEFPSPHGAPEVLGTQAREDSAKYERLVRELNITMS
jgi:hypothetical protein